MKFWVELWVRLKVVDLVQQTAWMTLTEKLDFNRFLCGLARYSYWGMEVEGLDREGVVREVDRVIRMDSAFTNQNKHFYRLMVRGADAAAAEKIEERGNLNLDRDFPVVPGSGGNNGPIHACDLLIREQGGERENGFTARLQTRLPGVTVRGMKAGEVWRILVRSKDKEEAVRLVEEMAVTRSRREGLLLNPHYQRHEIMRTTDLNVSKEWEG
ncbi:MAG: hypothetical protein JXB45_06570 [Candidatus Krumholzibacteriota bacterium]|nr:hypothetical protein [Candidatus Krumholzibacteriota bacterium]